jgi:hypothetical protein
MSTVIPRVGREVFPALGAFVGGGMVAGVIASVIMAEMIGFGDGRRVVHVVLSAALGAILGLFRGPQPQCLAFRRNVASARVGARSPPALGSLAR